MDKNDCKIGEFVLVKAIATVKVSKNYKRDLMRVPLLKPRVAQVTGHKHILSGSRMPSGINCCGDITPAEIKNGTKKTVCLIRFGILNKETMVQFEDLSPVLKTKGKQMVLPALAKS